MGVRKKIMDLTVEEAVNAATIGFGEIDTGSVSGSDSVRHALQMAVDFKLSQKQDEINTRLIRLTRWLVILTIGLVVLTIVLIIPAIKEVLKP